MSSGLSLCLYICIYSVSAILLTYSKNKNSKGIFIIAILIPVIFAMLRYQVGTDFENYVAIYEHIESLSFVEWFVSSRSLDGTRIGIWLLCEIAGFFDSSLIFFALFAVVIYLPVALRIREAGPEVDCFLCTFLFLTMIFTPGLNIMKQVAAVSFVIYSLKYVYERNLIKFILVILIACSFHVSAIIGVAIYFIWNPKAVSFNLNKLIVIIGCMAVLAFVPELLGVLGGRFASYADIIIQSGNKSFWMDLIWCLLFITLYRYYTCLNIRNDLLIAMVFVSVCMSFTGFYSPFIKRIALYYSFPQFILMAQLPMVFKSSERIIIKSLVYCYGIVLFALTYYILGQSDIIPYNFIGGK